MTTVRKITREDIEWAAIASQQHKPSIRITLPTRRDLTNEDFKRGSKRYKVMGLSTSPGKRGYWVCHPLNAKDSSEDLLLTRDEVESTIGEEMAESYLSTSPTTRRAHC